MRFTLCLPDGSRTAVELALPGRHNVQNSLAAAAVGWQLGVNSDAIARALQKFAGIGRRFNLLAQLTTSKGATVQLVDDYGHHPKELEAVFAAARGGWPDRRLVVAFQPHRYSRTRDLFDEFTKAFNQADVLLVTDIYAAGESPIEGVSAERLVQAIREHGHHDATYVPDKAALPEALERIVRPGDVVIALGAGDINACVRALKTRLEGGTGAAEGPSSKGQPGTPPGGSP